MTEDSKLNGTKLTDEQKAAVTSRAFALGVALALFTLVIYLATLARLG